MKGVALREGVSDEPGLAAAPPGAGQSCTRSARACPARCRASGSIAEHLGVDSRTAGPLDGAACASPLLDRNAMFPEQGDRRGADFARQVCASCPVNKAECLARYGHLSHGVVAGLTVAERRALRVGGGR